jgi:hypothetical protein
MSTKREFSNRTEWKNKQGHFHREDGPAIVWDDGTKQWFNNGVLHRLNGPAVTWHMGEEWIVNGKRNRTDGPAIDWDDGTKEWWVNDHYVHIY